MGIVGQNLVGIGLYTPSEAGRLIGVHAPRLTRWLRGHEVKGQMVRAPLAASGRLGDGKIYLSFRDLLEARIASQFITKGLSPQKVRLATGLC
jgi:hypothetical protein